MKSDLRRLQDDLIEVYRIMHGLEGCKVEDVFILSTAPTRIQATTLTNGQKHSFSQQVVTECIAWFGNKYQWLQESTSKIIQAQRGAAQEPERASCSSLKPPACGVISSSVNGKPTMVLCCLEC